MNFVEAPPDTGRVLVVEDRPDLVDFLRDSLERESRWRVTTARTTAEAVERLALGDVDVVLLDLTQAGTPGLEALDRLRAAAPEVPVVVLTSAEETDARVLLRGAQDYLTWDQLSPGLLDRALQHALVRTQADRRLRRSEQQLREAQAVGRVGSWEWDITSGSVVWSDEMYRLFGLDPSEFGPTYERFLSLVAAEDRDRMREIVERALAERRAFVFETRIVRGDGEVRHLYGRGDVILDAAGRPVRMVGIGQDISERKRAEEQREAALGRLQAIQSVTEATLAHLGLDELLQELLTRLRAVLKADSGSVLLLSKDRTHLTVRATQGLDDDTGELRIPVGRGLAGRIALSGRPLTLEDVSSAEILRPGLAAMAKSLIGAPLVVEGQVIGVLHVETHAPRGFTSDDVELLRLVADRVAQAVDRARLFAEASEAQARLEALSRRLVALQEEERRRISRELHDEVGQLLTALKLMMESRRRPRKEADGPGPRDPRDPLRSRWPQMNAIVNDLLTRVRDLSMSLRPPMLDDLGLLPALVWQIERFRSQTGLAVVLEHSGLERRLPRDVETAAFRIVQEALTNVVRHAGAREARVQVAADAEALRLSVEDRGRGFHVEAALAGATSGLAGMRERAHLLGGRWGIESRRGAGARVWAELPLASALEEEEH